MGLFDPESPDYVSWMCTCDMCRSGWEVQGCEPEEPPPTVHKLTSWELKVGDRVVDGSEQRRLRR